MKPPLRIRVRGKGAGGGVIHAPGVPGAPPLREIRIDQVTCADGSITSGMKATRMGNARQEVGQWREWWDWPQRSRGEGRGHGRHDGTILWWRYVAMAGPAVSCRVALSGVTAVSYPTRSRCWQAIS